jgi:hypothetical protein
MAGRRKVAAEFAKKQAVGTVAPAEDGSERGDERLDEATIEVGIENDEEGKRNVVRRACKAVAARRGVETGGKDGIIKHGRPPQ